VFGGIKNPENLWCNLDAADAYDGKRWHCTANKPLRS
jgi:hypothetical protein